MSTTHSEGEPASQGYYPGFIGKTLDNGRWKIIRKLGWDSRSSTWLAQDQRDDEISAIKVFTADATNSFDADNERKMLRQLKDMKIWYHEFPFIRFDFYEESENGNHLCLVSRVLGGSVEALRAQNVQGAYLPLYGAKKIVCDLADALSSLHEHGIIQNAVVPGNILHWVSDTTVRKWIENHPTASPSAGSIIPSQPIFLNDIKWNDPATKYAHMSFTLSNFSYACLGEASKSTSAIPSPESLAGKLITKKTDIWMLGYTAYVLLTGKAPFEENINLEELEHVIENLPVELEKNLKVIDGFPSKHITATVEFISDCMKSNPEERPSDLFGIQWVMGGSICSCGYGCGE